MVPYPMMSTSLLQPMLPLLQGTFGREPAAVKPDDDRYLRAAIQEYDNIAKLGQIIREGPIKVSPLLQGPVPKPCLNLTPTQECKEMVYLDLPSIRMEGSLGTRVNRLGSLWHLWTWKVSFQALFPSSAFGLDTCSTVTAMGV